MNMIKMYVQSITQIDFEDYKDELLRIEDVLHDNGDLKNALMLKDELDKQISERYNLQFPIAYNLSVQDNVDIAVAYQIEYNIPVVSTMYINDLSEIQDAQDELDDLGYHYETFYTFEEAINLGQIENGLG